MNPLLKHISSYTMIVVLLASTLQFSVSKMKCLESGNVSFSFTSYEECNKSNENQTISSSCCEIQKITFDYNYNSLIETQFIFIPFIIESYISFIEPTIISTKDIILFTATPPNIRFDLLKTIQVFRL